MGNKKQSKGIFLIIILAIIISGTLSWFITFIAMTFSGSEGKEPLPQKIIQTEISPNGKVSALLYEASTGESMNYLGSDIRYYLGIKKNDIIFIISRVWKTGDDH
jgi:hypothetical protein